METDKNLELAESRLAKFAISSQHPETNRLDVNIERKDLKNAVAALLEGKRWGYLSAITGLDNAVWKVNETTKEKVLDPSGGSLELLYHFSKSDAIVTLRVSLPYADAKVDSICDLIQSATLYEREASELLGIDFVGTPSREHLVLPDSWPDGVYPLRKSFTGFENVAKG